MHRNVRMYIISNNYYLVKAMKEISSRAHISLRCIMPDIIMLECFLEKIPPGCCVLIDIIDPLIIGKILMYSKHNGFNTIFLVNTQLTKMNNNSQVVSLKSSINAFIHAINYLSCNPLFRGLKTLTNREKEVLGFMSMEKSYSEIAKLLDIKPKVVSLHKANILHKLGLNIGNQGIIIAIGYFFSEEMLKKHVSRRLDLSILC